MNIEEMQRKIMQLSVDFEKHGMDLKVLGDIQYSFEYYYRKSRQLLDENIELKEQLAEYKNDIRLCKFCKYEYSEFRYDRCQLCMFNRHANKPNFEAK